MHMILFSRKAYSVLCLLAAALLMSITTAYAAERYVFISHAPDSDTWWTTIKNSLKQASEDFGVSVDYKNPKKGDIDEMARIIDESAAQKYDGMIVTIADYAILKSHLKEVVDKWHIPLVTVNSGTEEQSESVGALLHIGQPEHFAGLNAGAKAKTAGIKSFICFNHYSNNLASHERCKGFADGLGLTSFEEVNLTGDDREMQNTITNYLTTHNTEAILALGTTSAQPTLAALREIKSAKTPYFVTFDLSSQITEGIRKGAIAFAIDQQPYLQGYLAVGLLAKRKSVEEGELKMVKAVLYSQPKLHARMATYGLMPLFFGARHIKSGPAFVNRNNVDKVEIYSGTYR